MKGQSKTKGKLLPSVAPSGAKQRQLRFRFAVALPLRGNGGQRQRSCLVYAPLGQRQRSCLVFPLVLPFGQSVVCAPKGTTTKLLFPSGSLLCPFGNVSLQALQGHVLLPLRGKTEGILPCPKGQSNVKASYVPKEATANLRTITNM